MYTGTKVCINPKCEAHGQPQSISVFYKRSGFSETSEAGHYVSECKACMRQRSRTLAARRLPSTEPRALSEKLAIGYLNAHGIPALPGKAFLASDVDIVAWGCVRVEVKYSGLPLNERHFTFGLTRRQVQRGLLADVVMLVCDYEDRQTFHLFPPDEPAFYFLDGRRKGGFIFTPGQMEQKKHMQNHVTLTQPMMDTAQDRIGLITAALKRVSADLKLKARAQSHPSG